jgi:hypothetical protein
MYPVVGLQPIAEDVLSMTVAPSGTDGPRTPTNEEGRIGFMLGLEASSKLLDLAQMCGQSPYTLIDGCINTMWDSYIKSLDREG